MQHVRIICVIVLKYEVAAFETLCPPRHGVWASDAVSVPIKRSRVDLQEFINNTNEQYEKIHLAYENQCEHEKLETFCASIKVDER